MKVDDIEPPEQVVITSGRIVTKQTAWWYYNSPFDRRTDLYCIHNKCLLEGCNECRDGLCQE